MGFAAAFLFTRLQRARFYAGLHREAVALLPPGHGRHWLDIGGGPGLVGRLAAERGYRVTASDRDPVMVRVARCQARRAGLDGLHRCAGLEELAAQGVCAEVVSAASLLAVMPDREGAVRQLLNCVAPGGTLLAVEPDVSMDGRSARALLARQDLGPGRRWLLAWAATRVPARAVTAETFAVDGWRVQRVLLLHGLVNAWLVRAVASP